MRKRPFCILCLLMMLGIILLDIQEIPFWRKSPVFLSAKDLQEKQVKVYGKIERRILKGESVCYYLKSAKILEEEQEKKIGKLLVYLKGETKVPIGSEVCAEGCLQEIEGARNPGEFDLKKYYECQHIYYQLNKAEIVKQSLFYDKLLEGLQEIKESGNQILEEIAGTDAGTFEAILFGDKGNLDEERKTLYQLGGIMHVLAISGMHLSVLGMGFFTMLRKLGMRNAAAGFLAVIVIYFYGWMTGGNTATLRAVVMLLIQIGGILLGRSYDTLTALSVGAILLLIDSPDYLYSSSFLLSFGAVIGIGVLRPLLEENLPECKGNVRKKIRDSILISLSVQLMILPITLYFYYEISLAGLWINLLIVPTVTLVLLSGLVGVLAAIVKPSIGRKLILPGRILLKGYEWLCRKGIDTGVSTWIAGKPTGIQIAVYYLLLLGSLWVWRCHIKKENQIWKKGIAVLGAGAGILQFGYHAGKNFSITALDVGQGDCLVITLPGNRIYISDGGSNSKTEIGSRILIPYLKYLGIQEVDGVFLSHTDEDHISGIEEWMELQKQKLTALSIKKLYLPDWKEKTEKLKALEELAEEADISVYYVGKGDMLHNEKVKIEILNPEKDAEIEDVNEGSIVFQITYKQMKGMFMGDAGIEIEEQIDKNLTQCQFLKVGHHGSKTASGADFLGRVRPKVCFISCSENNKYGHPAKETLERLKKYGGNVWITKESGAITAEFKEDYVKISEFCKE